MKELSEIELKTCPFCGGKAKFRTTNSFTPSIWVYCSKCNAKSNAFDNSLYYCAAEKAAENWNSRLEGNNVIQIDAESVIRCKDCEYYREAHYEAEGDPPHIKHQCRWSHYRVQPDGYCYRAVKKGDSEE